MKHYLYSIVVISVASALFRVLCPDRENLRKYFSFLTSAVLLCATVVPISGLIEGIRHGAGLLQLEILDQRDYSEVWKESLVGTTREESERAIAELICGEFGIEEKNIGVFCSISTAGDGMVLDSVTVTLYSAALLENPRRIETYLRETLSVPCKVEEGGIGAR